MSKPAQPAAGAAEAPGKAILAAIASGRRTVSETARECLDTIQAREPDIKAFVHLDPEAVLAEARELDRIPPGDRAKPLLGLPVGVKDLIDTADQPTEYGSRLFAGHRPAGDAAVVRKLRDAGALPVGKTVTTEFACFSPGPTRNPRDLQRTPGGSSSGSAAAVAAGMLPVALGTQTAGSVIRPASFCGIVGFKPTFGAIDRTGVFPISETLDTVGLLSRSVADISVVFDVVRAGSSRSDAQAGAGAGATVSPGGTKPVRLGFARPVEWDRADPETRAGLEALKLQLMDSNTQVVETSLPAEYDGLTAAQSLIMDFEVSKALMSRCEKNPELVSSSLMEVLKRGAAISASDYSAALELADKCRAMLPEVFGAIDAVVVPAVIGEAPMGLQATGDPLFGRSWTLLHCPAISLPLLEGPNGLPVGVQLVGNLHRDDDLLRTAQSLMDWSR
ncbi:amidase [Arthrobacter sp. B3I4]|uniref:amidase n=1 Tax=Arthrobacter sp. B3I4 TaxID=3042267 RepID=UPI002782DFFF|nr:amidase [Arthrobacter sp. B3I4]MDQ0757330.1 Asp-tRNA(Asn)/Glu-tRNA(Gln) amidotransferase A subunit family amidase [Arthrobacter sp. B3I4]